MPFVLYQGEKRIADIVRHTYGSLDAGERTRAREVLLRANPHLDDLDSVSEGSLIVVPELPGIRVADDANEGDNLVGEVGAALTEELRDLVVDLRAASQADRDDTAALDQLIKDDELVRVIEKLGEGERLERVRATVARRDREADERDEFLKLATDSVKRMDSLFDQFGLSG